MGRMHAISHLAKSSFDICSVKIKELSGSVVKNRFYWKNG